MSGVASRNTDLLSEDLPDASIDQLPTQYVVDLSKLNLTTEDAGVEVQVFIHICGYCPPGFQFFDCPGYSYMVHYIYNLVVLLVVRAIIAVAASYLASARAISEESPSRAIYSLCGTSLGAQGTKAGLRQNFCPTSGAR